MHVKGRNHVLAAPVITLKCQRPVTEYVACSPVTATASTRPRLSVRRWRGRSVARGSCSTTRSGYARKRVERGEKISDTEVQRRVITLAKTTPGREWLGEVASVALVQACQDARRAYRNWFDSLTGRRKGRKAGHPQFRAQARAPVHPPHPQRVRPPRPRLYVAKVGDLKVKWSRDLPSVPSSVTVIREADGRYYASFVVERDAQPLPPCDRETGDRRGAGRAGGHVGRACHPEPAFPPQSRAAAEESTASAVAQAERQQEPGEGPAPGRGPAPQGTGNTARPRPQDSPGRWSATTKRSTPRTSLSQGLPAPGWPSRCTTPAGPALLRLIGEKAQFHGRYFARIGRLPGFRRLAQQVPQLRSQNVGLLERPPTEPYAQRRPALRPRQRAGTAAARPSPALLHPRPGPGHAGRYRR